MSALLQILLLLPYSSPLRGPNSAFLKRLLWKGVIKRKARIGRCLAFGCSGRT